MSLYTEEFFRLVRSRLNEGGIASYWLPVHSLSLSGARAIVAGFCNAFQDCSLWKGADLDWMLVGSRGTTRRVTEERLREPESGPLGAKSNRRQNGFGSGVIATWDSESPRQIRAPGRLPI